MKSFAQMEMPNKELLLMYYFEISEPVLFQFYLSKKLNQYLSFLGIF